MCDVKYSKDGDGSADKRNQNTQKEQVRITAWTGRNCDCDYKKDDSVVTNEPLACFDSQPEIRDTKFNESSKGKLDNNNCVTSDRSDIETRSECANNDGGCIDDDCEIVNTSQKYKLKVISLDDNDSDPENDVPLVHFREHGTDSDPENDVPLVHLKMLNHQKENEPKMKKPQNVDADFSGNDDDLLQVKADSATCRSKIDN